MAIMTAAWPGDPWAQNGQCLACAMWMLHIMLEPAHSERHPHLKIQLHRLMKNTESTTSDNASGDHLENTAGNTRVA